jgi:diaminopimelate epimerase
MRFAKYHGTGNDFVMIEDLDDRLDLRASMVAALCDRRRGIGADGVIRVVKAEGADFFMDYRNADGEVAEMCGNGIRCLAKLVHERGLSSAMTLDVATRAGVKRLVLDVAGGVVERVTVDMGPPALERASIPMTGPPAERFLQQPVVASGRTFVATAVSMGNPHCVVLLDALDELAAMDVPAVGSAIEHLPLFPERTNVEFVVADGDGRIDVRVWERGSGETLACGTGACASLVACALAGKTGRRARLRFPGGLLDLGWREEDDHVLMTGPAVRVFEGDLDETWLSTVSDGS